MGMNIYTMDGVHIGKRFAAGIWCWDCRIPMTEDKERRYYDKQTEQWTCPKCGEKSKKDGYNPAFRELGFDKSKPKKCKGVEGASGFTWHIGDGALGESPADVKRVLRNKKKYPKVKTEYGDKLSNKEFWDIFKQVIKEKASEGVFS